MTKDNSQLTDTHLEIMTLIWKLGEATVADVWRELQKNRQVARNTVQTTLVRLEEKGYLRHRVRGNTFVYIPTKKREPTLRKVLKGITKSAFGGSTKGLVMSLLESEGLTADELKQVEELLNKKKQGGKK